jgi:hypothetical protein
MTVTDEHAILRGLEDFRIAGAMQPETPATMRRRLEISQAVERERERHEAMARQFEYEREDRQRRVEAARAARAEAWKRGEPVAEPKPRPLPVEVVVPQMRPTVYGNAFFGAYSASSYPCASASGIW